MSDLKPCPFCGEAPYSDEETARIFGIKTGWNYAIACSHCESVGSCSETMVGAINLWNSRHIPEGYALVPLEMTEEMLESGKVAHYEADKEADEAFDPKGMGLRRNRVAHIYKAIITAAQGEEING